MAYRGEYEGHPQGIVRDIGEISNISGLHPKVLEMYARPFFKQGTDEWLRQREGYLTASDVAAVLGNCVFKDKDTVFSLKTGLIEPQPATEAMRHGTYTEPEAREKYESITGKRVIQFGLLTGSDSCPFLGASVDGITTDGIVVEIKCPYSRKIENGKMPAHYYDQVQTQLEVVGLETAHYFEYDSKTGNTNLIVVKRDHGWMNNITRRALFDFWKDVEFHRKTFNHRLETYQPKPVSLESLSKYPDSFFTKVYMADFTLATAYGQNGELREQWGTLITLGQKCETEGLGYYNLAEDVYQRAESICLQNEMIHELSVSLIFRSRVYADIGMKWYATSLAKTAINLARDIPRTNPNYIENAIHITHSEMLIAHYYLNFMKDNMTDQERYINNIAALYWISQALTSITDNSLDLQIPDDLKNFHNHMGEYYGWDKLNEFLNDKDVQKVLNSGAY